MAKKAGASLFRLVSSAGTGSFYLTTRNTKKLTTKIQKMKFDAKIRKHVLFKEAKMK